MISRFYQITTILLILSLFISCDKKNESFVINGKKIISVKVEGINSPLELRASSNILSTSSDVNIQSKLTGKADIAYETYFTAMSTSRDFQKFKQASLNTSKLDNNITYRFVLFVKNGSKYDFVQFKDAVNNGTNGSLSFELDTDKSYKWIAYSYNNLDPILDNINRTSVNIETSIFKDLLYANGVIDAQDQSQTISIKFNHRLARIAVALKADQYPGKIVNTANGTNISVKLAAENKGYFKKASFNILEDQMSTPESVIYDEILPFSKPNNAVGDSVQIAYLYTADMVNKLNNLKLRFENVLIKDMYPSPEDKAVNLSGVDVVIEAKDIVPQRGYSYSPTVNFKFANGGVLSGTIVWSRGELTYDHPTNTHRFKVYNRSTQLQSVVDDDYWLFNSITPWDSHITKDVGQTPRIWEDSKDPCRQVAGGWRLPTREEGLLLLGEDVKAADKVQTAFWTTDSKVTWSDAQNTRVNIPANAYRSFKGADGNWLTFYKSGLIDVSKSYYTKEFRNEWKLIVPDSYFMPVIADGVVQSFATLQTDGRNTRNFFSTNTNDKHERIPVRCVKNL